MPSDRIDEGLTFFKKSVKAKKYVWQLSIFDLKARENQGKRITPPDRCYTQVILQGHSHKLCLFAVVLTTKDR